MTECSHPTRTEVLAWIDSNVKEHGWAVISVMDNPPFAYSIGFQALDYPEVVLTGLDLKIAHSLIKRLYEAIGEGLQLYSGAVVEEIANMPVKFISVTEENKQKYMLLVNDYYGHWDFKAMQMLWPDPNGVFPGEDGYDNDYREVQTLLGDPLKVDH